MRTLPGLEMAYRLCSMRTLIRLTGRQLILPFYHAVSDVAIPHIRHLYPVKSIAQFEQDLDAFCQHYRPISLAELQQHVLQDKPLREPSFYLSFDDGLKEVYSVIAPILERKGIPATLFINSGFLDNKGLFFRYKVSLLIEHITQDVDARQALARAIGMDKHTLAALKKRLLALRYHDRDLIDDLAREVSLNITKYLHDHSPYLTSVQVSNLIARGFTIGAHSVDHPLFATLSLTEQKNQIIESCSHLMKTFHLDEIAFSFPFTDDGVSAELINWLHSETQISLSFGISGLKDDITSAHLHRIPFEGVRDSATDVLKSAYLYFMIKHLLGKNKITR